MTDVLMLSGIPIPMLASSDLEFDQELLGDVKRTASGELMSTGRGLRWVLAGATAPCPLADSLALRALINGEGHSWSFDGGTRSSKGIVPSVITGFAAAVLGGAKFGPGRLLCQPGGSIRWDLPQAGEVVATSTLAAWVRTPVINGGAWSHVVIDVDTQQTWLNGAEWFVWDDMVGDTRVAFELTASYVQVGFLADGDSELSVDDLVVLPYRVPASWRTALASSPVPFGPLPYHRVTGAGVHAAGTRPLTMLGRATRGVLLETWTGGSFAPLETFDFEMKESRR